MSGDEMQCGCRWETRGGVAELVTCMTHGEWTIPTAQAFQREQTAFIAQPMQNEQFASLSTAMITTCETCRYSKQATGYQVHQCRRSAPSMNTVPAHLDLRRHVPVWPIVNSGDWCGEHQPKDSTS